MLRDGARGAHAVRPLNGRPISRRRLFSGAAVPALGALGALSALGACVPGAGSGERGEIAPKAQLRKGAKIVWAIDEQGGSARAELRREQLGLFTRQFPDIGVELLEGATSTEKLVALFAGGTPPDYFRQDVAGMAQFAARGQVTALDPYMRRDKYDLSDFYPTAWEQFRWKEKHYGTPFLGVRVFYANRALIDSVGARKPPTTWRDPNWTWDAFMASCQNIVRRDGETTTRWAVDLGTSKRDWQPWVWSNGGDVFTPEGTRLLLTEPPAVEALQFMADLIHKHRLAPTMDELRAAGGQRGLFLGSSLGYHHGALNPLIEYRRDAGFAWGLPGLPRGKGKTAVSSGGGVGWFIAVDSRVKDETWEFAKVMVSKESQRLEGKQSGIASRRSVMNDPTVVSTSEAPGQEIKSVGEALELLRPDTPLIQGPEIDRILTEQLGALWRGQKTAREAVAAAAGPIAPLLNPAAA